MPCHQLAGSTGSRSARAGRGPADLSQLPCHWWRHELGRLRNISRSVHCFAAKPGVIDQAEKPQVKIAKRRRLTHRTGLNRTQESQAAGVF